MSVLNQKTINQNITFKGVGLHSGLEANVTIKPAEPNAGIVFKRTDINKLLYPISLMLTAQFFVQLYQMKVELVFQR